jgi:general secretion pathway protein N
MMTRHAAFGALLRGPLPLPLLLLLLLPLLWLLLSLLAAPATAANPDVPAGDLSSSPVERLESAPDITAPRNVRPSTSAPAGNPLWAVPLSALTATRDRPLFAPTRRPPPAAVPFVRPPAPPPPPVAEAGPPRLRLLGTVINDREKIAVFQDDASQSIIRIRLGEQHAGWVLRSVQGRSVTLEGNNREATFSLPQAQQ